jgi:hypothetical protein
LGHRGPAWHHVGAILGRRGGILGHLEAIFGYLGTMLGPFGAVLGRPGAILDHLGGVLELRTGKARKWDDNTPPNPNEERRKKNTNGKHPSLFPSLAHLQLQLTPLPRWDPEEASFHDTRNIAQNRRNAQTCVIKLYAVCEDVTLHSETKKKTLSQ